MDFNNYGNENRRNDFDGQGNSESTDNDILSNVSPNTGGDREHEINRDADTAAAQSTSQYAGADSAQNMNQYTNGYAGHGMNQHINGQMGSGLNQHTNDSANYGTGHNINNDMGYGGYPNNSNGNYGPNRTGQSPYGYPYPPSYKMPGKSLATASMILGIISILSTILMTLYIPMILGSIAIVLAILSKGSKNNMPGQATAGIVCGAGGLVVNVGIFTAALVFVFSHPEILQETARTYDTFLEQYYGESTEEMFGQSMEDMINETFGLE